MFIQNQSGNHPRRFGQTGTVVEVKQHDQYNVKVDGSGRVTLRNRRYLRKFEPVKQINQAIDPGFKEPIPMDPTELPSRTTTEQPAQQPAAGPQPAVLAPPRNLSPRQWAETPAYSPPHRAGTPEYAQPTAADSPGFHGFSTPGPRPRVRKLGSLVSSPDVMPRRLEFTQEYPTPEAVPRSTRSGRTVKPPAWHSDYAEEMYPAMCGYQPAYGYGYQPAYGQQEPGCYTVHGLQWHGQTAYGW